MLEEMSSRETQGASPQPNQQMIISRRGVADPRRREHGEKAKKIHKAHEQKNQKPVIHRLRRFTQIFTDFQRLVGANLFAECLRRLAGPPLKKGDKGDFLMGRDEPATANTGKGNESSE